jgi:hypothetical protein
MEVDSPPRSVRFSSLLLLLTLLCMACGGGSDDTESEWQTVQSGLPAALTSIWGTSATDVWAVGGDPEGTGNTVMHFDGGAWSSMTTGFGGDLWWVFGFQDGPVFMTGADGLILRYQDGEFERMETPGNATVYGIWGTSPDDLWAVGGNVAAGAFAWRFEGTAWTEAEGFPPVLVQSTSLFKVWGASADDVWLVGTGGAILHYDGERLTQVRSDTTRDLFTVSGNSEVAAAVGGFGTGVIVENEGSGWADVTPETTPQVVGVWLGEDAGYAVGIEGAVMQRVEGTWEQVETGIQVEGALHTVWVDPDGGVWVVGGQVLASPLVDGVMIYRPPPESTS